jgi:hypothetical protein
MDCPTTTQEAFSMATKRFFNDAASECYTHCVKDFLNKEMNLSEKNCVNTCYKKQMIIYDNVEDLMINK